MHKLYLTAYIHDYVMLLPISLLSPASDRKGC